MDNQLLLGMYIVLAGFVSLMIGRGVGPRLGLVVFSVFFAVFMLAINILVGLCFSAVLVIVVSAVLMQKT